MGWDSTRTANYPGCRASPAPWPTRSRSRSRNCFETSPEVRPCPRKTSRKNRLSPRRRKTRPSDEEERRTRRSRRDRDEDDEDSDRRRRPAASGVEEIIPYHNPKALVAYYLGVFSLIPVVGLALGPTALILDILGVRASNANSKARGLAHGVVAIILGALTSLGNWGILAFVVLMAATH